MTQEEAENEIDAMFGDSRGKRPRKQPAKNPSDYISCMVCKEALNGEWKMHAKCLSRRIKEKKWI